MQAKRGTEKKVNPHAKNTYRVLSEPFKIMGILDWRYAFVAAVPATFFGLVAHSVIAGLIVGALACWQAWQIADDDPNLPLVWWLTLFDKKDLDPFRADNKGKGK